MLQAQVLETIKQNNLIQKNDKIVIAVSGGPDSMCLLDILYALKEKLEIKLVVAHINHQIRIEAKEETKYVEDFCKKMNIPCYIKYADVNKMAREQKLGTEEMGRKIRYNFFEEVAKKVGATKIATAHSASDNAETVLMNILRGSGIAGLKGIEIARNSYSKSKENNMEKRITFIRPLRNNTRTQIEEYCKQHKLNPKIDKSNFENIYTRNKIRNELIPYLQKEFNPNIVETLNRLSNIAKEEEQYFTQIIKEKYETLKIGENEKEIILNLTKFNILPKVIKVKLLLYTINKLNGNAQGIGKVHLEDIIKLCQNNIGNKYLMPNKNVKIFVKKGKIFFMAKPNLP